MMASSKHNVLVIVILIVVAIDVAHGEHFRGGMMSWEAMDDGNVALSYSLAWKADAEKDDGPPVDNNCTFARVEANTLVEGNHGTSGGLRLDYRGIPASVEENMYPMPYHCTERHEAADYPQNLTRSWVMGKNTITVSPPPDGRREFDILYHSCCWVRSLVNYHVFPRSWDLVTSVDLNPREDTGTVNTSPITNFIPVQRISKGCNFVVLNIPTYDADGDDVTCRWVSASLGECTENCYRPRVWPSNVFQRIRSRDGICKLFLKPSRAETGWYAVALMLEDSSNGVVHSKVPLQFMIEFTDDTDCTVPVLVSPPADTCWMVSVGETLSFNVTARIASDGSQIGSITTTNFWGMHKSALHQVPDSQTDYYVTITWTPTADDEGVHPFCFQPEDSNGVQGRQSCIKISVGDGQVPTPDEFFSNPGAGRKIFVNTTTFEVAFDLMVARPNQESEIRILLAADRSLVHTVKVEPAPTDGVLFSYNAILFSIPAGSLQNNVTYTLELPEGLARGYGTCEPWSRAASWNFSTGPFGSPAITEPPTHRPEVFLGDPQCFGTFMQLFVPKTMVPFEDPTMMRLNEPTCVGSDHNATHFSIGTQYQYCSTQIRTLPDDRKSIISNTVHIPSMTVPGYQHATRRNATAINMVCEMSNDLTTYVEFEPDAPAVVYNRTSAGEFNFSLRMFPDDSFTSSARFSYASYPVEVTLSQRLFFEAKAFIDSALSLRIFLKSCEATPSPNPVDLLYYRFIEDGCAVDQTVVFISQTERKIRFSIEAFAFLGHFQSDTIFVHCNVQARDGDSGEPDCPVADNASKRRRRHANTAGLSRAHFLTQGPFRLAAKPK